MIRARGVSRKGNFFMKTDGSKRCLYLGGGGLSLLIFSGTELDWTMFSYETLYINFSDIELG